ncbi:MAG: hypothetical protein EA425_01460 [Puniceicoccaceae bacterium]|nr:MAG: hypothetical protein EA425_01460 [Puniceicoccaceae bacterium]
MEVAAGDSVSVELEGYCTDVRKPAPDAGTPLPPGRWTPGMMPLPERFRAPPRSQSPARGAPVLAATFPGELRTIEAHWEPDDHPSFTTALLLRCLERIGPALSRLRDSDTFVTPYSDEPEKERRILTQQVLWLYLALIRDHVYGKSAFEAALARQLEQVLDVPFTEWPAEDQETFVYGADDLWSATLHLAKEAKLLRSLE